MPKIDEVKRKWKYLFDAHTTYCIENIHGTKAEINKAVKAHQRDMVRKTFHSTYHALDYELQPDTGASRIKVTTYREDDVNYCLVELMER